MIGDLCLQFLLWRDDLLYVRTTLFYLLTVPAVAAYVIMRAADLVDNLRS